MVTIDVDPDSPQYGQIIHRLPLGVGDELHHTGWNSCSSCFDDPSKSRSLLILPALGSTRVHAVDVKTDPKAPRLYKTVEKEDIVAKTGITFLHTTHCAADGTIVVSGMGDPDGNAKGAFLVLDEDLNIKGTWSDHPTEFGYDYWVQYRKNVLVSSSWGAPKAFSGGFNPAHVEEGLYGKNLYFWDFAKKQVEQVIDLGSDGLIPLEVRFKHDPDSWDGFVGAALSSNVIHFTRDPTPGSKWHAEPVIKQPWTTVEGWVLPQVPPLITDILISLDDKYIYFSNWLRGDIVQYDISDPRAPKLAGRLFVGGVIRKGGGLKIIDGLPEDVKEAPEIPTVQGKELQGGPQMIQLSLDGKRLYVTNSLYSPWDKQFYPDLANKGSYLLKVDVDIEKGGLTLDPNFFIDFGAEPGGPALAHEVRYPGADCSSDIWV